MRAFQEFWRLLVRAQVTAYKNADRLNKITLVASWMFMAYAMLTFIWPWLPFPMWLFLVLLTAIGIVILRDHIRFGRELRKFKKDGDRLVRMMDTAEKGGDFSDLPPEDQEEWKIIAAKHRLQDKDD